MRRIYVVIMLVVYGCTSSVGHVRAQDAAIKPEATTNVAESAAEQPAAAPSPPARPPAKKLPEPKDAQRLSPDYDVWVDKKNGVVIVDGQVSLREGMLEMFACTRNTKEHEAIVSANTKAFLVHSGLLVIGAVPGHPVRFVPKYEPPAGTEIEVTVEWTDASGKTQKARAEEWIKDIKTGKPMTQPWVFAGSRFWTDPDTGKNYYQAEGGDFICVSNFGTAMMDIPVESSQANDELAFQTFTEKIPPLGTPVRLILKPKLEKQGAGGPAQEKIKAEGGGGKAEGDIGSSMPMRDGKR